MKNVSNNVNLISKSEVIDQFDLSERPKDTSNKKHLRKDFSACTPEGSNFIVYTGNADLKGDFSLDGANIGEDGNKDGDWKQWCDALGIKIELAGTKQIAGVIVDGNLNVDGSLFNCNDEDGMFFVVTGNLTAKNLTAGGAIIHILGNANVEECIYSNYNDGLMRIMGDLTTTVYVNADHFTKIHGKLNASYIVSTDSDVKNRGGLKFDEEGGFIIPASLKKILSYRALADNDLLPALERDGTIFRKPGDVPPERTEEEWIFIINYKKEYKFPKDLPEKFKTEEFYCKVADTIVALGAIEDAAKNFPKEYITDKVRARIEKACENNCNWVLRDDPRCDPEERSRLLEQLAKLKINKK